MTETISSAEVVWLFVSVSTVLFSLYAIYTVNGDRAALSKFDPLYNKKMALVNWCFSRHCFTTAIGCLFTIVTLSSFFSPQVADWSPTILALTSIPVLIDLKIINDIIRKRNLLRSF